MDSREGGGIVTLSTKLTTHIFLQKIKSWAEDIFKSSHVSPKLENKYAIEKR